MKKYSLLILFTIFSVAVVNAQRQSYSVYTFNTEDFEQAMDSLSTNLNSGPFMAYFGGDTTYTTMRFNFTNSGGKKHQHMQTQVFTMKRKESMREIQSQRIAFFTDAMALTPEEAQAFWPLYNQYTEKKNELVEKQNAIMRGLNEEHFSAMTAKESETLVANLVNLQKQESDLLQEYHAKFMKQLSAKKVLQMYKAEKDFMQNLLWHLKGPRRGGN